VLRVADCALVVIHAQHGPGVGTERVWNCASDCGHSENLVVNAMDKPNVRFDDVLATRAAHFGPRVLPAQCAGQPVLGSIRCSTCCAATSSLTRLPAAASSSEAPAEAHEERVTQLHRELIELIAESDTRCSRSFSTRAACRKRNLRAGIHAAVQRQHFIPLFCLSAESDIGVAACLEFSSRSTAVRRSTGKKNRRARQDGAEVEVALSDASPSRRYQDDGRGALRRVVVLSRLFRQRLDRSGALNADRQITERIGQIYLLNGVTARREQSARR